MSYLWPRRRDTILHSLRQTRGDEVRSVVYIGGFISCTDHVPNEGTAFDQATLAQELQKECLRVLKASDNIGTPRETGSGFFEAGAYLPDVGSISLSFPRIRALLPWTPEFPVAR